MIDIEYNNYIFSLPPKNISPYWQLKKCYIFFCTDNFASQCPNEPDIHRYFQIHIADRDVFNLLFLSSTFIYKPILIQISMNANIMKNIYFEMNLIK